jgi:RNA polymerase nonessential primary-like sigma factor
MPSPTTDLVRSYLKEIGRYPLLTPGQEITNARLVQQMMAIEEQRSSLALQLNRQPTARELAASLGQSEAEVQSIILREMPSTTSTQAIQNSPYR